ncbi:hypothetical protein [Brunnivagina elsteri]|uniref:hypothetical protein n=1 Tax=Brunnivagina elsteri TaxID=1247191 RepID=UPI001178A5A8|nr:hypothetical protein [Calothrix elsteri]
MRQVRGRKPTPFGYPAGTPRANASSTGRKPTPPTGLTAKWTHPTTTIVENLFIGVPEINTYT